MFQTHDLDFISETNQFPTWKWMEHISKFTYVWLFDFMEWSIIIAIASGCSATIKAGWSLAKWKNQETVIKLAAEDTELYILITECFEEAIMHISQIEHAHRVESYRLASKGISR